MTVKLCLRYGKKIRRIGCILGFALVCALPVAAQDGPAVKAAPVTAVQQEELPPLGNAPIVVELFTSQACTFCPKADRLFADIIKQDNVIGLACHVDYFDVKSGSLAKPFCTDRQSWYMEKLFAGPNYTPQMVINGALDVVGYKFNDVVKSLRKSAISEVLPLRVIPSDVQGTYKVLLPPGQVLDNDYKVWLALYDKPHELTIADGPNKGNRASYYNVVSQLGSTDRLDTDIYVTPPVTQANEGFVVLLQNMRTGRIHAVGRVTL